MTALRLATLLLLSSCTNDVRTVNAAQAMGLHAVQAGSYSPWSCAKDDFTSQKFHATNINGDRVSGVVCCGIFKGCTVRF